MIKKSSAPWSAPSAGCSALDFGRDENDNPAPIDLDLTPSAKGEWVRFYNEHNERQESLIGPLASAYSKLEGGAARLALIVQLLRWAADTGTDDVIDDDSMRAGVELARWFCREADRVYIALDESDEEREQRATVDLIRRRGSRVTPRDLMRANPRRYPTAAMAEEDLTALAKAGLGAWEPVRPDAKGGRPTRVFCLSDGADTDTTGEFAGENGVVSLSTGDNGSE